MADAITLPKGGTKNTDQDLRIDATDTNVTALGAATTYASAFDAANLLRLGAFYLWVDGDGLLRINSGAPEADDDGVAVGDQAEA